MLVGAAEAFIAVGALWERDADAAHAARARAAAHLRAAGEPSLEALLSLGMAELLTERFADAPPPPHAASNWPTAPARRSCSSRSPSSPPWRSPSGST